MDTTDTVTVYGYADGTAGFTEPCEICGNEVDADALDDSGICDDCHLES
jgi:hypothetical protein